MRPVHCFALLALLALVAGCYSHPRAPGATIPPPARSPAPEIGPDGRVGTVWIEFGGAKSFGVNTEWDDGTPILNGDDGYRHEIDGALGVVASPGVTLSFTGSHHRLAIADIRQSTTTVGARARIYLSR